MPPPEKAKPTPAQVLLGEAAGEGIQGMQFVRDVMFNRTKGGKTLDQVVSAPAQFSAYARPDLAEFYAKQPATLQALAEQLIAEASKPDYQPAYPEEYYVTDEAWRNRGERPPKHWLHKMDVSRRVGNHVALILKPQPARSK